MSIPDPAENGVETAREASQSAYSALLEVVLLGIVVILPIVITIYVLSAALGILVGILDPIVRTLQYLGLLQSIQSNVVVDFLVQAGIYEDAAAFVEEITAAVILVAVILVVGTLARSRHGDRILGGIDGFLARIPALGTIYRTFRRMGDAMLEGDVQNFQSVKLVEFPRDGTYVIGFETAESPASVRRSARHPEMTTLFLPLAPNPVMGGFLAHLPTDRVMDVDMTVEEGVQSIVTSGVAVSGGADLSEEELREMGVDGADLSTGDADSS